MRRDRALGALVAILGIAILAATIQLVHLASIVNDNHRQLDGQQQVIKQLAGAAAAARQDARAQQRLIRALQKQVRSLGGVPLTEAPTPRTRPGTQATPKRRPAATPTATPRPSPHPTARPSTKPTPTGSPTPTPSPTLCVPNIICLPVGSPFALAAPGRASWFAYSGRNSAGSARARVRGFVPRGRYTFRRE